MTIRQTVKKITPTPVWGMGSDIYWWWHNRGRHLLAQTFDPRWSESMRKLKQLENTHAGQALLSSSAMVPACARPI